MVTRCSNGVGFIVLEPEAAFRTGISIEIYEAANPLNLIDVLPDSFGRKWTDQRKGTGAGELKVYADNPKVLANPNLLQPGNIVRMLLDRVPRFAFKIEKRQLVQIGEGDDSAVAWHIQGRGALSLLEDGQVYPAGGLSGDPERSFAAVTPGDLMLTLLGEAQARPSSVLSLITEGFTATEDANNIPYTNTMTLEERAGTDLLRIAERISELAADVYMTPTLELRIVNSRGIDRTLQTVDVGPIVLQKGANVLELSRSEDAVIRNALLIETPGGFVERLEAASISGYRRREAYISLGNITDSSQIDRAAEAVFERSANPAESITIKVTDDEGRRPYVDWGVGDWVLAPDNAGILERFRVNALTIAETEAGTIEAIPELASLTDDLEERLARWLKSMARGTMGGTAADVTEPNQVTAEVQSAIDDNLNQHEATFLHPDELADLADVDVTGLADYDILRYDQAAGDWKPEALELDTLADVDAAAPAEGDMLYRNDSGLWVIVGGTKADGKAPMVQADGSVSWETPAGGGGGTDPTNKPLYDSAAYTDQGLSDEFDAGTLDGQWTAVAISAGTVDPLTPNPTDTIYDLTTRPGSLLVQLKPGDNNQGIRADAAIADGEEIVVAMSIANVGDNPQAGNGLHLGIGFNNNDADWASGTTQPIFWDGADDDRILWGAGGVSGQILTGYVTDLWTYWRVVRDGSTLRPFFSKNCRTWTPMPGLAFGSSDNFWVFWDTNSVNHDHAPIIEVAYVRHTTYAGLDPEWVT